ncbi:hypothetical protein SAMN04487957_102439 [Halomonas shengliensis]|uniref:Uncharacterized protein n=1 Tax=Halomonas shengliensis TaxID=419597 RepID=A0A1H0FG62_9GAMM|nr:hypothetical protein [Halomonas shengliensis]SDN93693.1 hypothetical protein SAMN04487957_102439 [Halomonas shengliensis]
MRQFLFPRRPLARGTLLTCHLLLQLGLAAGAALWLAPRTPWLSATTWQAAWPDVALGVGLWLLAAVVLRLVAELWLLPHHLAGQLGAGPVITRSWERRPAVHDREAAWTSEARPLDGEDEVVGRARVTRPAEPLRQRGREPSLDLAAHAGEAAAPRDPRL